MGLLSWLATPSNLSKVQSLGMVPSFYVCVGSLPTHLDELFQNVQPLSWVLLPWPGLEREGREPWPMGIDLWNQISNLLILWLDPDPFGIWLNVLFMQLWSNWNGPYVCQGCNLGPISEAHVPLNAGEILFSLCLCEKPLPGVKRISARFEIVLVKSMIIWLGQLKCM